MDAERYQRLKRIFFEANRLPSDARDAYLLRACGDDAELLAEARSLLVSPSVATGELVTPIDAVLEAPVPERCGPYRVGPELGRGGMGAVYEATDERTGARVALKLIHAHLGFRERMDREVRLGMAVDHPNVVRALDSGEWSGRPYLVMEYVEGKDLRRLLRELGTVPETLLREIALQVCAGLEAIHAKGIVHRDIKPENICLTADDRVRLMDLGIAKPFDASEELTQHGQFLGSLHYASPEQCGAGAVDPRSDLYSLGVVLYELATGSNPFQRDEPGAVIRSHLDQTPRPVDEVRAEVSPFLSEVIATLLAKAPADRFASAAAVAAVLRDGERGTWWAERERLRRGRRLPPVAVRRETKLHGRGGELAAMRDAWARAGNGEGAVVVIEGEPGLGKTRLVDAFLRDLDPGAAHVLYGSFPPTRSLQGLTEAIAQLLGAGRIEDGLRRYLPDIDPALRDAFAGLVRDGAPSPGAAVLTPDVLEAVCCALLRGLSRERPTLWVLDDLHFAPAEARAAAMALARAAASQRALVVVTARPDFAESAALDRLPHARRLALGRLSPREVIQLLQEAFGSEGLADRLGGKIAYKSDGVPFFVFEMIRALKEGQFLQQRADGTYYQTREIEEIEVPSAVRDLIAGRLGDLTREERSLLDVASVLGYEFDAELLAPVLQLPLVRVLQALAEIERRHGVVQAAGRNYRFDHHQIQEVVYEDLPERLREEYHALVADAYAARLEGREPGGEDELVLARHHLRGSRPDDALPHVMPALTHLRLRARYADTLRLSEVALARAAGLAGELRIDVLMRLAQAANLLGRNDRAEQAHEEAIRVADAIDQPFQRARTRRLYAEFLTWMARNDEALAMLESAVALLPPGERRLEGDLISTRGMILRNQGRLGDALAEYERHHEIALEIGTSTALSISFARLGSLCLELGDYERGEKLLTQHLQLNDESGARRQSAVTIGNLGIVSWRRGRSAEARARYEAYLEGSRETGYRRGEAIARFNLSEVAARLGDYAEARRLLDLAHETAVELGVGVLHEQIQFGLGRVALAAGDLATAETRFEEGLASALETRNVANESEARLMLGLLADRRGERDAALESLRLADEATRATGEHTLLVLVAAHRARLGAIPAAEAEALCHEHRNALGHTEMLDVQWALWKATGDAAHLAEAQRLLDHLCAHAPEADRETMRERVALYREISAAR